MLKIPETRKEKTTRLLPVKGRDPFILSKVAPFYTVQVIFYTILSQV
jgi:hypothetical protein